MRRPLLTFSTLIILFSLALLLSVSVGVAQINRPGFESPGNSRPGIDRPISEPPSFLSTACALQPERKPNRASLRDQILRHLVAMNSGAINLSRFRWVPPTVADKQLRMSGSGKSGTFYQPTEEIALIHPTNFGDRYLLDVKGKPTLYDPIIVLHETVGSANSAINYFRTAHWNDADQSSYHTLIRRTGNVVYLLPPDKRAFGAGNSVFLGANGVEASQTNPSLSPSVNNFAYHVSLETPPDGNDNGRTHSGYTEAQYQSLAWLLAKTGVPNERITTHQIVDRSGSRIDPRSFDFTRFFRLLNQYPRTAEIAIRCTSPQV